VSVAVDLRETDLKFAPSNMVCPAKQREASRVLTQD
jgi:hypothetical protein